MIDSTVGTESVTWYEDGIEDPRRVQITFIDGLPDFAGLPLEGLFGDKLPEILKIPGMIELFGDDSKHPMGRMTVSDPSKLDELAEALQIAAQSWRHCIKECECFNSEEDTLDSSPEKEQKGHEGYEFEIVSLGDFLKDAHGGRPEPENR